jgi:hypothetical protein
VEQLVFVERLAAAVAFDDGREQQFGRLESSEALGARQTLAAPANLSTLACKAGVDDFSLRVTAKRAMHGE